MGKFAIACVVRDVPHPTLPKGTILFTNGAYELPNGERRSASGALLTVFVPPTDRNTLSGIPSYK